MTLSLSQDDVLRIAHDSGVEFIRLQVTDIFGVMKNVAITIEELEKALNGDILFDGSSIDGSLRNQETDMYLKPDPSTFVIYPWRTSSGLDARLICDVHTQENKPFEGDPRYVLKRALKKAEEMGFSMRVATECEFFLFHTDEKGRPTIKTHDNAGYYDLAPVDLGETARRDMVVALKQMGFEIEASHHEIAPGQHEIDLKADDALYAADKIMTFKAVVRIVAQRHGLHATFMPKPLYGIAGSGLHLSQAFYRGDVNAFYDPDDKLRLSRDAYSYLGGLLKHSTAFTALTNPIINSYKRIASGYDAPSYNTWSAKNSSSLIKVPAFKGQDSMLELRSPDASCNPYLALAVILVSGFDGIEKNLNPSLSIDKNAYKVDAMDRKENNVSSLPDSLEKALSCLKEDEYLKAFLGEYIYSRFMEAKLLEWQEYIRTVSGWELEQYLTRF